MIYKIVLIFIAFFSTLVSASDYEWKASINKRIAFVNEAVYLKYECIFTKDAQLYTIDFNPARSTDKYDLLLLKEDKNIYEYVAFIKQAGDIDFSFDAIMKKTTLDSIAEMTGGLDDEKAKDGFVNEYIKQKKLSLHVRYPNGVEPIANSLVGDFQLEIKKDELSKKAFSPFHFEVIIKGIGNFQDIKPIEFNIKDVKIFAKKPIKKIVLNKDGYSGIWSQKFAFVSEQSFSIKEFSIKYFDTGDKILKELKSELLNIEVSPGYKKEKLLDLEEKKIEINYKYLFFTLAFIFGFLLGKIKFKKEKELSTKETLFNEKVKNTSSLDELLILLILQNSSKYTNIISQIEKEEIKSLEKAKKLF